MVPSQTELFAWYQVRLSSVYSAEFTLINPHLHEVVLPFKWYRVHYATRSSFAVIAHIKSQPPVLIINLTLLHSPLSPHTQGIKWSYS